MSIGRHTAYTLLSHATPVIVALATVPVFIRLIGTERYGALALIWTTLNYFAFFDLGMSRSLTHRMSRTAPDDTIGRTRMLWTALICALVLGAVGGVILVAVSELMFRHVLDVQSAAQREASNAVVWMAAALPMLFCGAMLSGALQSRLRFGELAIINSAYSATAQLAPLLSAVAGYVDLKYLIPSVLVVRLAHIALLMRTCRSSVPLRGRPVLDRSHLSALISYGKWVSVMSLVAPFLMTVDRLIIGAIGGAKAVAFYSVPYDMVSRALVIPSSLSSAAFPRLVARTDDESDQLAIRATDALLFVMTPIAIIGITFADTFLRLWLGVDFATSSAGVAEMLFLGVWFNAITVSYHARYMARGNPRAVALIYLAEAPVYAGCLYVGVNLLGVAGAAVAWMLRVLLDMIALLSLNRVLFRVLLLAAPFAIPLGGVLALHFFALDHLALRTAAAAASILYTTWLGRDFLIHGFSIVRSKFATVSS